MSPFLPKGEQARWRVVYAILQRSPVDAVIRYEELGEVLGLDPESERHAIQMAMRRAAAELETEDRRAVDSVPNKGYRIVRAPEQLGLAQQQGRKATRALARGYSKSAHVNLDEVEDPNTRRALELTAQAFELQMDFNKRFAVRQEQLERAVRNMTSAQETERKRTSDEVSQLRDEVVRLRRRVDGDGD